MTHHRSLVAASVLLLSAAAANAERVTCVDGIVTTRRSACAPHGGVLFAGIRCQDGTISKKQARHACRDHGGIVNPARPVQPTNTPDTVQPTNTPDTVQP